MMFAVAITGLRNAGRRLIRMPSGMPTASASKVEIPTIHKCSKVRSAISPRFCETKFQKFICSLAHAQPIRTLPHISSQEFQRTSETPEENRARRAGPLQATLFCFPGTMLHEGHG